MALFADDTLLYSSSIRITAAVKKLQRQIDIVQPWLNQWRITINPSKTTTILFTNKHTNDTPKIKIQNTPIKWSPSIKYLGFHIDKKLCFAKHIKNTINKAKATAYILYPLINKKSRLSLNTKIYIYKTYIRPVITYASPAWASNISKSSWSKLESIQARTLRTISNQPWFVRNQTIRNSAKIQTIKEEITKSIEKYKTNIISSHFKHISNIAQRLTVNYAIQNKPINFI